MLSTLAEVFSFFLGDRYHCAHECHPASRLYRMVNDDTGLQADFMPVIHGVRSFEGLKSRAVRYTIGNQPLLVATLADIIKSKKAAGRDRDRAVIPVSEQTLRMIRDQ